ncbi:hypothetical protein [Spiroplasma sp. DGKH1]|uniref:hypothetical protein n=1 Tax=Spiroplasma sp. DGKH1 TaxID=3050074 RepID=UPI0034C5CA78
MKTMSIDLHYNKIKNQLETVVQTEKIIDSTNPIYMLLTDLKIIRNSPVVLSEDGFLERLNLLLADMYKILVLRCETLWAEYREEYYHHFRKNLNLKQEKEKFLIAAERQLAENYGDRLADIDFIYIQYLIYKLLTNEIQEISRRKIQAINFS